MGAQALEGFQLGFLGLHLGQFEVHRTRLQGDQFFHQAGGVEAGADAEYGGNGHGKILFKFQDR